MPCNCMELSSVCTQIGTVTHKGNLIGIWVIVQVIQDISIDLVSERSEKSATGVSESMIKPSMVTPDRDEVRRFLSRLQ